MNNVQQRLKLSCPTDVYILEPTLVGAYYVRTLNNWYHYQISSTEFTNNNPYCYCHTELQPTVHYIKSNTNYEDNNIIVIQDPNNYITKFIHNLNDTSLLSELKLVKMKPDNKRGSNGIDTGFCPSFNSRQIKELNNVTIPQLQEHTGNEIFVRTMLELTTVLKEINSQYSHQKDQQLHCIDGID